MADSLRDESLSFPNSQSKSEFSHSFFGILLPPHRTLALIPGADHREARGSHKLSCVWPLHLPPFPSYMEVFGTARSGPWTARTVLKHGAEGKGGQAAEATTDTSSCTAGFLRCLVRLVYPRILL